MEQNCRIIIPGASEENITIFLTMPRDISNEAGIWCRKAEMLRRKQVLNAAICLTGVAPRFFYQDICDTRQTAELRVKINAVFLLYFRSDV